MVRTSAELDNATFAFNMARFALRPDEFTPDPRFVVCGGALYATSATAFISGGFVVDNLSTGLSCDARWLVLLSLFLSVRGLLKRALLFRDGWLH